MASLDFKTFGTTSDDLERVSNFILERGAPVSSRELAASLIEWRIHEEEKRLAKAAARHVSIYQPKESYAVNQRLAFTALNNREGVVQKIRPGENPRLGAFQVMTVLLEGDTQPREFAMAYPLPHPLNEEISSAAELPSRDEAVAQYGEKVRENLLHQLRTNQEFVHLDDGWFLRGLLPQIHAGYLNLAEAAIEQANDVLKTSDLVQVLEIPEPRKSVADFALRLALANDSRFEDVGPANSAHWFLVRLEPPEARTCPAILHTLPARRTTLPPELETIAAELQDKADLNGELEANQGVPREEVTLILTWPHRHAGTLPLTPIVRALLPSFTQPRLRFALVDATTQEKIPAFAVREGNYIAGLTQWFNARKLAPGAYVMLKRGPDPLTLWLDYQPQRERGLWVRVARSTNGQLTFSHERRPIAHKYDEEMLFLIGDPLGLETAAQRAREHRSLNALLEEIFPELTKLSSAGRVHAKTLYSAVNLVRRVGPRTVLSALHESSAFAFVGGGYFVLNESRRSS